MIAGSALGVGLLLGLLAWRTWSHKKHPALVWVLCLICGLCVAGSVASFFQLNAGFNIFGLGLGGATIVAGWELWLQAKHGKHPNLTPGIALAFGILVMVGPIGGPLRATGQQIEQGVVTHVQNANFSTGTPAVPAKAPAGHGKK